MRMVACGEAGLLQHLPPKERDTKASSKLELCRCPQRLLHLLSAGLVGPGHVLPHAAVVLPEICEHLRF